MLEVRQTFMGNLDDGREESDGADFWFQAVSETERYLDPREDATFALGGGQPVGRFGCEGADLGSDPIPTDEMKGRYVCANTDEGRYCEFYVDEITPSPGVMRFAYTTWAE